MNRKSLLLLVSLPFFVSCSGPSSLSLSSSSTNGSSSTSTSSSQVEVATDFSIVCPQGAPAASFTRYASDDSLQLASAPVVQASFTSAEADFIVFDSVNGMKLSGDNYRLVRMVTFGNLYLLSTGNDEDGIPTDDDFVFSYGEGLVPDRAFKASMNLTVDAYGSSVSDTAPVLKSGMYQGERVDYVVSSYPVITQILLDDTKPTDVQVVADIAEEYGKKYGTDGFPQAGLFIKKSLQDDDSRRDEIEHFLSLFDEDVLDLIDGASKAVSNLEAYGDLMTQQARFGFNANVLSKSQEQNGLAFLSANKNPSAEEFLAFSSLGISLPEGILSTYYPAQ